MLPGTKELSHLLNRLYDAASGVASWEQFLQTLVHTGSG